MADWLVRIGDSPEPSKSVRYFYASRLRLSRTPGKAGLGRAAAIAVCLRQILPKTIRTPQDALRSPGFDIEEISFEAAA
ncbi:hypothetical protein [Desulfolutivibrio sp.]|uniref:hypothetical protein n=1 Tax=Desulfolutivibrio sp. TaxID=2773296 RepID=UPI002F969BD7